MFVEQGFWTLYESMHLIDPAGADLGVLAPAIALARYWSSDTVWGRRSPPIWRLI
jgi:hypothetical protein